MRVFLGLCIFLLAPLGCPLTQTPVDQPSGTQVIVCAPTDDAGDESGLFPEPFEADKSEEALGLKSPCARACYAMAHLPDGVCPESVKLPGGNTCIVNCTKYAKISSFNPECIARAKTRAEMQKCPNLKCEK